MQATTESAREKAKEDITMKDIAKQADAMQDLSAKVSKLFQRRMQLAQDRFNESVQAAYRDQIADLIGKPMSPWDI